MKLNIKKVATAAMKPVKHIDADFGSFTLLTNDSGSFTKRALRFEGENIMTWEEGGGGATNVKFSSEAGKDEVANLISLVFDELVR